MKIIPVEEFAVAEAVDETYREKYSLTKWYACTATSPLRFCFRGGGGCTQDTKW